MTNNNMESLSKKSMFSYAIANSTGFQFIKAIVAAYILNFFTDSFLIPAGAASIILLVGSIWDAINDPMMGALADRTKSRFGRYRVYLLVCPVILTVVSYMLFLNPSNLSDGAKIAWAAVFYILYGMAVTAVEMPLAALLPAMANKDEDRNKTVQLMIFIASICFLIVSSYTLRMQAAVGGYQNLMLISGVVMIVTFFILFKNSKEKYLAPASEKSLLEDVKSMLKIKELYPVMIVWAMGSLGYGIMMSASIYYMIYYICRPDLLESYMLVMSVAGMVSVTFGISLLMKIFKGSVKKCFAFSQAITAVLYVIAFFVGGKSLAALYVLSALASAFATMSNAFIPMINNEMIDYVAYRTGEHMNATVSAVKGFAYKCGAGLASCSLALALHFTGYEANNIGSQSDLALLGLNLGRFGIPAVAAIILCIAIQFYPVDKSRAAINEMKAKMNTVKM